MQWLIARKSCGSGPIGDIERVQIRRFLDAAQAWKYAPDPLRPAVIHFFTDPSKLGRARREEPLPDGFSLYSNDPAYMPMAFRGIENEWEEDHAWLTALPRNHKELTAEIRK